MEEVRLALAASGSPAGSGTARRHGERCSGL